MTQYKLIYFDFRGFGEGVRILLHYGEIAFEDLRIEQEEWLELKPNVPYGQLPVLEIDGQRIAHSAAIYRFLGRQLDLVPKCPIQEAMVDAAHDAFREFYGQISKYLLIRQGFDDGDECNLCVTVDNCTYNFLNLQDEVLEEEVIPARDLYFSFVKTDLLKSDGIHLIGKKLSWIDLIIADSLLVLNGMIPSLFDGFPEVKKFVDEVHNLPKLKRYFEERPPRPF
uniref:Glutathione S-transferase 1 n=1 Tax=Syphacia muris TaxID=451379 RepID=A0A0N5AUG8_9BILA